MNLPRVGVRGDLFVDAAGRQMILRGVNLGGDCKVPYPRGGTNWPSDFSDHRDVSFIGRPFPLAEADEHLGRLTHWGFNCVRLLTTWEAVEHAGPGVYDTAYLDYFAEVARRAGEHGLYVFVDFHQDVWSRMTGGDGAPGWTHEAAGLDFTRFAAAGAAHVMQARYDYADPRPRQAAYPQMSWGSNHRLSANAILWTLFWIGALVTPDFRVEGENIQDFLRNRYLGAMAEVARRLAPLPNVLGFDTLNEPGVGMVGEPLSYRHVGPSEINPTHPRPGAALSPLDQLAAARGLPVTAPFFRRNPETGRAEAAGQATVNSAGISIWRDGFDCPFERAGAYRLEGRRALSLDEDFFRRRDGRLISVSEDGYGPFFHQVAATIRAHNPAWAVFAEIDAFGAAAGRPFPRSLPEGGVCADHWYDGATLYLKRFDPGAAGPRNSDPFAQTRERFAREIAFRAEPAKGFPGGAPSLVGEFGVPFDLDGGAAFDAWANGERDPAIWRAHVLALELMYDALDRLQLSSAQWNYTASNRNDLRIGDGWNQEDLSIFSRDQQDDPADPDSGGRAIEGFCRPYAQAVQGRLERVAFHRQSGVFELAFAADPSIEADTLVYLPRIQYPNGYDVELAGPAVSLGEREQRLELSAKAAGPVRLTVKRRQRPRS
jgi:hypothetical protein